MIWSRCVQKFEMIEGLRNKLWTKDFALDLGAR